ncbi:hypothetical protein [Cellulomonas rhizosphaerae]|uniref:Uncharacterized protein n=1 Tax=Cellulomonas rhizosphaerae TaxID=2293719 RepID=A0A413RP37_9CELL|nr:hypothetical protein [Cellulomonas rhizosphaerae]RHA43674.1 hypothetical protein D1825_05165 [Cellulomonas rhizosphaerae]
MARLRIGGIGADDPPAVPRLRIGGISADGAVVASSRRLRIGGISADGAFAVLLQPLTGMSDVEPLTTITLTAVPAPGSPTPDSYVWSVDSGAAVVFSGAGATRSFPAPASPTGASTTIAVQAVKSGVYSPVQKATFTVLPHQIWRPNGAVWAPAKTVALV